MSHKFTFSVILIFLFIVFIPYSNATVITLHIPIVKESPKQHLYHHELIETALKEIGHTPKIIVKAYSQSKIKELLNKGKISIFWMIESKERNNTFIPIEVGITNGLIGKRIIFIKKGDQNLYDKVKTVDDFRNLNLVGGMGRDWFDASVWKANNLLYKECPGNWDTIFKKIASGTEYNYFSRGLNEIVTESKQHTDLDIEKKLVLIYDRDFRYYLSKTGPNAGAKYKAVIENAIEKAHNSGLINRLIKKYWGNDYKILNYDQRIKLYLKTPDYFN